MLISEFIIALETVVPLSAAGYERDAIGLQIGLPKGTELSAALFAYELTDKVIAEAQKRGANLIVAFHPLIFPNVAAITDQTRTGALIRDLIKNDIALYIQHTAFDTQPEFGTSILMAQALELENVSTLKEINPIIQPPIDGLNFGMGATGNWPKAKKLNEVLDLVIETFHTEFVRYNSAGPGKIKKVAMLGGAGMEYYKNAVDSGADAFITADIRYHDFHRADHDKILLIDAGHAETERFVALGMVNAARKALDIAENVQESRETAEKVVNLHGSYGKKTFNGSSKTFNVSSRLLLLTHSEPNAVRYYCQNRNDPRMSDHTLSK